MHPVCYFAGPARSIAPKGTPLPQGRDATVPSMQLRGSSRPGIIQPLSLIPPLDAIARLPPSRCHHPTPSHPRRRPSHTQFKQRRLQDIPAPFILSGAPWRRRPLKTGCCWQAPAPAPCGYAAAPTPRQAPPSCSPILGACCLAVIRRRCKWGPSSVRLSPALSLPMCLHVKCHVMSAMSSNQ